MSSSPADLQIVKLGADVLTRISHADSISPADLHDIEMVRKELQRLVEGVRDAARVAKVQAIVRARPVSSAYALLRTSMTMEQLRTRARLVRHFEREEERYVGYLRLVVNHFLDPLSEHKRKLHVSTQEVMLIFSNVRSLLSLHSSFAASLANVVSKLPLSCEVGKLFMSIATDLYPLYSAYCVNSKSSAALLYSLEARSRPFAQWLKERESESELGLGELLSFPFNRAANWAVFLKQLMELGCGGTDPFLEQAYGLVTHASFEISRSLQLRSNHTELEKIQAQIVKPKGFNLIVGGKGDRLLLERHVFKDDQGDIELLLFEDSVCALRQGRRGALTVEHMLELVRVEPIFDDEGFGISFPEFDPRLTQDLRTEIRRYSQDSPDVASILAKIDSGVILLDGSLDSVKVVKARRLLARLLPRTRAQSNPTPVLTVHTNDAAVFARWKKQLCLRGKQNRFGHSLSSLAYQAGRENPGPLWVPAAYEEIENDPKELSRFLAELPDPLFGGSNYSELMNAWAAGTLVAVAKREFEKLPQARHGVIRRVLARCMHDPNCTVKLAPVLLRPRVETTESRLQADQVCDVLISLVEHAGEIYPELREADEQHTTEGDYDDEDDDSVIVIEEPDCGPGVDVGPCVSEAAGWSIEPMGQTSASAKVACVPRSPYREFFFSKKAHYFVLKANKGTEVAAYHRGKLLVFRKEGYSLTDVESPPSKPWRAVAASKAEQFSKKMLNLDAGQPWALTKFRIGVVGRDTPAFRAFLESIGERVSLASHRGYRGQLMGSESEYSYYTMCDGCEIMFHVSTLLSAEQLRRLLGNDVVIIQFQEDEQCDLAQISQMTQMVAVIAPRGQKYRLDMVSRRSWKRFSVEPEMPRVPLFEQTELREFLLRKLINGYRACLMFGAIGKMYRVPRVEALTEMGLFFSSRSSRSFGRESRD